MINELKSELKIKSKKAIQLLIRWKDKTLSEIKSAVEEKYADIEDKNINEVMSYFKKIEKDVVRSQILNDKSRIDGRKLDEVRDISSEVSWLPRTHGSSLLLEVKHRQ